MQTSRITFESKYTNTKLFNHFNISEFEATLSYFSVFAILDADLLEFFTNNLFSVFCIIELIQ